MGYDTGSYEGFLLYGSQPTKEFLNWSGTLMITIRLAYYYYFL